MAAGRRGDMKICACLFVGSNVRKVRQRKYVVGVKLRTAVKPRRESALNRQLRICEPEGCACGLLDICLPHQPSGNSGAPATLTKPQVLLPQLTRGVKPHISFKVSHGDTQSPQNTGRSMRCAFNIRHCPPQCARFDRILGRHSRSLHLESITLP